MGIRVHLSLEERQLITWNEVIVPSDRVLKGFFDQKHVSIEPDVQKQVIRLAVDAVNDVNAANGKEVSMQENDERLFDRGSQPCFPCRETDSSPPVAGKDAANLRSLARLLSRGPGLPVAMRLYDVAVSHGDMDSEYDVARMLATGVLDIPDGQKIALQRLEDLVQRGHLPSKYTYASHLANSGQAEEGWAMMREIAEAGFADAQAQLGHALREGFEGVEKDPEEAVEWLEKAVAQGEFAGHPV